ncbi:hypothetical protein NUU61_008189 [Penicillium alfredii]|uniref:Uncharacterized protein n=1 Tax=Penicillium alfredii TaxID=1506179 RepID=A0A9W9JZS8_9EURO|nr:uncharacterized protein NUU61_008189 [Penicillium alfredii]KAJ5086882.1 hypothetical protein NUU61_008189 [Penicillium alfredii]
MKLYLAAAIFLATGPLAAGSTEMLASCFKSGATSSNGYYWTSCKPNGGGRYGTITSEKTGSWCYIKAYDHATSPMECGTKPDDNHGPPVCLEKQDDEKLGGCGVSGS